MQPDFPNHPLSVKIADTPQGDAKAARVKRPIRVRDSRSARRMLSRVIDTLQGGPIERDTRETLRLLVYSLSVFVQVYEQAELEARLLHLEELATKGVQGKNS